MAKKSSMSISGSSIGVQLIQTMTGTAQQPAMADQSDSNRDDDKVAPVDPVRSSPPPGMGRYVDKNA
jgi:hypothetical protein